MVRWRQGATFFAVLAVLLVSACAPTKTAMPEDRKNCCAEYEGKEVVLGVRPEHIHAPKYAPPNIDPSHIIGTVDVLELLGAELHLYVNTGKNTLVATVDPRMDVNTGNEIDLVMDMSAAHIFDKDTERAIR